MKTSADSSGKEASFITEIKQTKYYTVVDVGEEAVPWGMSRVGESDQDVVWCVLVQKKWRG